MKEYIVTLSRNIGIGKDIVNYFNNRGFYVTFEDEGVFPKTIIVATNNPLEELLNLMYVVNVTEGRVSN